MRQNPSFALAEEAAVAQLAREHPWMTIVSSTDASGLVASHYPVLLDDDADGLVLLTHVGRPDEVLHELGAHEVLVIVQGPHGYISPGWYDPETPAVPTWNFVSAHLYGTPELLDADENLRVLEALVDHFEAAMAEPRRMRGTPENSAYADRISAGTVGVRIPITRFVAKNKMSQNKPRETVDRIIAELDGDGPYASAALAAEMRRTHEALRSARP
ncbi:FMN-binding negative transcriptional regulator [Agromyces aerolatus]|uniref:FMN-binding negative transcriptional regulator n=1 Tax=Agromyces sp. LY-1074 TaxID=3074080 RepID=UPI0028625373|nr:MULTISPECIES: FMN-binding negative transcriptional regulator [unclassified Agromyces]MDR5699872.1 FMN-binding negative transcriptional regulator [Agromyces sp. LY-1074]MDR5706316.1 FMN-binding negative transcriptional regulator [Agromyces sp. LY-1358]